MENRTKIYEIYNAKLVYRNCQDVRPVIIIEDVQSDLVTVALISGAMDLYQGPTVHFLMDLTHPDFATTGLGKKCYVAGDEIFTINIKCLIRRRGMLTGELLIRFKEWI